MMFSKKILLTLFTLVILTSCSIKREDLYTLSFDDISITVGYDAETIIKERNDIDTYSSLLNKKDEYILQEVTIYLDDINGEMYLDDYLLNKNISETCSDLNGELKTNNGNVCVLYKKVNNKNNVVMMYGDILDDNSDKIDRIEVSYK